jgi:hypothetical protein
MGTQAPPGRNAGEARWGPDRLTAALRERIRAGIVTLVEGELTETLAALPDPRTEGRRGSRQGRERRTITTGLGAATVERRGGAGSRGGATGRQTRPRRPPAPREGLGVGMDRKEIVHSRAHG